MKAARMIKVRTQLLAAAVYFAFGVAFAQKEVDGKMPDIREWTSQDGKKLNAAFLGTRGNDIMLKLANGRIAPVALARLTEADREFVARNRSEYHPPWRAWPRDEIGTTLRIPVSEAGADGGGFAYTTRNFRFHSEVNLGVNLMTELARVFELTHELHTQSPFGILATPKAKLFEARFFSSQDSYSKAGGSPKSAGVYLTKEMEFLAPLDLMGMSKGTSGWRKNPDDYDPSTIVHELTHMLTHDMLDCLPIWVNEGYAEYISNIPIDNQVFQTSRESIREGIWSLYLREHAKANGRSFSKLSRMSRSKLPETLASIQLPELYKVAKVLQMTDEEWATDRKPGLPAEGDRRQPTTVKIGGVDVVVPTPIEFDPQFTGSNPRADRMPRLYRTAHLILYYFIQIEGEKGVLKIRRFLEENRKNRSRYQQYEREFANYEMEVAAFLKLPGVTRVGGDKISYPSNLQPPKPPAAPFKDPSELKTGGLVRLLDGEPANVVGERIEKALTEDLRMMLEFSDNPSTGLR